MLFCMNLFAWQKQKSLSNRKLAAILGVHESYITYLKAGKRNASLSLAKRIEEITEGDVTKMEVLFPEQSGATPAP